MNNKKNKALILVDASYFMYYVMHGSVSEFKKKCSDEYAYWIKPADETDQSNLPNILNCDSYKRILKQYVMKRCETIDWIVKSNFQDDIDFMDKIDIVFAMDDHTSNSFRKQLYPAYKAHRKLAKKQFDTYKIREYIFNVIFKELELAEKYGYKFISVDGAEADDIIATAFNRCSDDYILKILISSDHDFLQINGIHQLDLMGKDIKPKIGNIELLKEEYLLGKILLGDTSDNIVNVFKGVGSKKVIKYIKDRAFLKESLLQDADAAAQFSLNKKLISFNEIPKDLSDKIAEKINMTLYDNEVLNDNGFANIDWL